MPIGFGRLEFVQRTAGKNVCAKAAYNAREKVNFYGTNFAESKTYDWTRKEKPAYHEIVLPKHVDESFKFIETLWNAAEEKENRKNSVVAMEMVLALPDDKMISLEDRIDLTGTFIKEHFVDKGLAAQIDIHYPDKKIILSQETGELENLNHNWHAHILLSTRRFKENGLELDDHKARDLMNDMTGGFVNSGPNWGKIWAQHQNHFFEDKGLDLRVDENGIISQKHLGPVRMRGRAFALEEENLTQSLLNQIESKDPEKILRKITETKSVFSFQDIERFLEKHVEPEYVDQVRHEFWKQEKVMQLFDSKTKSSLDKYSTFEILKEEKLIIRLADKIHQSPAFKLKLKDEESFKVQLNQEQKQAFNKIIQGQKLSCIEGHAGTGKSFLLSALRECYVQQGYTVRAFGPDNVTSAILKEKGFTESENIYRFLFLIHHDKIKISNGKEIWILDEAAKLGNRPLLEFLKEAKKHQIQLIFSGCSSQLPSVERGGLFEAFCARYGAEVLIEIQRQKKLEQREMAKNLAYGNMAVAIDQLVNLHGLKWSETKEESIEKLIKNWAVDQTAFPTGSSLIVAHTNSEVRVLNEMARLYLREKGKLEDVEYACQTQDGKKIIVSVGDQIEFRKNDNELGIKNGMRGTLVEASPTSFVVALQDQERKIVFNPEKYVSFQLGYATTYHRSQGQTLDRVYVLHSPQMNKEKFYVTLTRHSHHVNLYASRDDVSSIADIKRQAFRKNPRENTLKYTTEQQIKQLEFHQEREKTIEQLKSSSSISEKFQGYTLGAWDAIKGKFQTHWQSFKDIHSNRSFYHLDLKKDNVKGKVVRIKDDYLDYSQCQDLQKKFIKILEKIERPFHSAKTSERLADWRNLSEQNKSLLNQYYQTLTQASNLYSIVESEAKGQDLKGAFHFKEWQKACATRNTQAHEILNVVPQAIIQEAIGKKGFQILQVRASKHATMIQGKNHSKVNLIEELKERIEPLLYHLFPDGPTGKDSKGLRFGFKGSLSVVCKGKRIGNFYDFEKGQGGGLLKLIQVMLNLSSAEAKEWAKNFLGQSKEINPPSFFQFNAHSQSVQEWNSLKPDPAYGAPSLKELSLLLSQKYDEATRHAYRDEKGDLLFYVLRLVDKEDPTKKQMRPLSFGYWQGSEKPSWCLKGYQTEKRPLYHLEQLSRNPLAKVLVVEGEKTADAAQKMFEDKDMICVTWHGGSSAVQKTDWTPLHRKEVIIWPDNDQAGFKAVDQLCGLLRQVGVNSLSLVDKERLTKDFPEKWDLADPLPQGKIHKHLIDIMFMAKEKSVGIDRFNSLFNEKELSLEKLHAQEILWRVEERLWSKLEEKYGNHEEEIKRNILKEIRSLLFQQDILKKELQVHHQMSPDLAERMAMQLTILQAESGKPVNLSQIQELKQAMTFIKPHQFDSLKAGNTNDLFNFAKEKSISEALSLGISSETLVKNLKKEVDENVQKMMTQVKIQESIRELQKEQFKQKDKGLDIGL